MLKKQFKAIICCMCYLLFGVGYEKKRKKHLSPHRAGGKCLIKSQRCHKSVLIAESHSSQLRNFGNFFCKFLLHFPNNNSFFPISSGMDLCFLGTLITAPIMLKLPLCGQKILIRLKSCVFSRQLRWHRFSLRLAKIQLLSTLS